MDKFLKHIIAFSIFSVFSMSASDRLNDQHCSLLSSKARTQCGTTGHTMADCEEMNCCFNNSTLGPSKCYHFNNGQEYPGIARFSSNYKQEKGRRLIFEIEKIIDNFLLLKSKISKIQTDHKIARTVGASVSTVSSILILGSIIAAPFTGGTSLVVGLAGVAGSVAGGATQIYSSIIENVQSKGWVQEFKENAKILDAEWRSTMTGIVTHPRWNEKAFSEHQILYEKALLTGMIIAESSHVGYGTFVYFATDVTLKTVATAIGIYSSQFFHASIKNTVSLTALPALISTTAASVFGSGLPILSIGLNINNIIQEWIADPEMENAIGAHVDNWRMVTLEFEVYCSRYPEACEDREEYCQRSSSKLLTEIRRSNNMHQQQLGTKNWMAVISCADIDKLWRQRYSKNDSNKYENASSHSSINYVGYAKKETETDLLYIATHLTGRVHTGNLKNPRYWEQFSSRWNIRTKLIGNEADFKGEIVESKNGGPIKWYNLFAMSPDLNKSLQSYREFGKVDVDNWIHSFVRRGCGFVDFNIYLNYNSELSKVSGIKMCLVPFGDAFKWPLTNDNAGLYFSNT